MPQQAQCPLMLSEASFHNMTIGRIPSVEGGIQPTIVDAKGDLIAGVAADSVNRLAVGSNGQYLSADSAETTGLKWVTPAGAITNFTLLNTGGTALTGATTITVSGITAINSLLIFVDGASSVNASSYIALRLNTDSGTNYNNIYNGQESGAISQGATKNATDYILGRMSTSAGSTVSSFINIFGTNSTGIKSIISNTAGNFSYTQSGTYVGTSAISSVSITSSTGNFDAGTVFVYGSTN
jgi:hypothetical protein